FLGSLRNSTSSDTSSFASSTPATSLKVVRFFSLLSIRALLLPKLNAPLPAILSWRIRKNHTSAPNRMNGRSEYTTPSRRVFGWFTSNLPEFRRILSSLGNNRYVFLKETSTG